MSRFLKIEKVLVNIGISNLNFGELKNKKILFDCKIEILLCIIYIYNIYTILK